jgi:hypothetical protein
MTRNCLETREGASRFWVKHWGDIAVSQRDVLLHGWPFDPRCYDDVRGPLAPSAIASLCRIFAALDRPSSVRRIFSALACPKFSVSWETAMSCNASSLKAIES